MPENNIPKFEAASHAYDLKYRLDTITNFTHLRSFFSSSRAQGAQTLVTNDSHFV
jgi:hypothetical protein